MKHETFKVSYGYVLVIHREDGTKNDYRFSSKTEMNHWMKRAGMEVAYQ